MGMELRTNDRRSGRERLSRLTPPDLAEPAADGPPDVLDPDPARVADDADPVDDGRDAQEAAAARWGATAMPDWLDSPQGRRAWARRPSVIPSDEPDDRHADDDLDDDWDPPRRRWTMLPPAAIGLIVVGLLGTLFAGYSLLRSSEPVAPVVAFDETVEAQSVPRGESSAGAGTDASVSRTAEPSEVVVSVVGLVRRPGLVRLAPGSRVADAIEKAGGARPGADLLSLNMAQQLRDGDQVLIGRSGGDQVRSAVVSAGADGGSVTGGPSGARGAPTSAKLDLNTASETELDALPGVGPVTAKAIVAWREANGRFASVDQLAEVDGIGPGKLAKLKPLVTV